ILPNKLCLIYVIMINSFSDYYHIKIGKSLNWDTLQGRLRTYHSIAPNAVIMCTEMFNESKEYEVINKLKQKYKSVSTELFEIKQEETERFVRDICYLFEINGQHTNVNFKCITGCEYSHYRRQGYHNHQFCDDRCLGKE